jgi:hypothetical protein
VFRIRILIPTFLALPGLVRSTDPRIRIRIWILAKQNVSDPQQCFREVPVVSRKGIIQNSYSRGCMHRRVFIKKTWLSAFSYAQSRISLVFCCSLGFLVPWFSPSQLNKIWQIFVLCMKKKVGDFNCLFAKTISH